MVIINKCLTQAFGILSLNHIFIEHVFMFKSSIYTCLLFPFDPEEQVQMIIILHMVYTYFNFNIHFASVPCNWF